MAPSRRPRLLPSRDRSASHPQAHECTGCVLGAGRDGEVGGGGGGGEGGAQRAGSDAEEAESAGVAGCSGGRNDQVVALEDRLGVYAEAAAPLAGSPRVRPVL